MSGFREIRRNEYLLETIKELVETRGTSRLLLCKNKEFIYDEIARANSLNTILIIAFDFTERALFSALL